MVTNSILPAVHNQGSSLASSACVARKITQYCKVNLPK